MNALTDTLRPELRTPASVSSVTGVVRLMLTDFRSYAHLRVDLDTRPVVLTGPNGAGKTNILEALSYLSSGRGLRGAKLADVGRRAPDEGEGRPWAVSAEVETASGFVRLGTGIEAGSPDRRAVHVDGKSAKSATAFAPYLGAVWLVPSMDRLFADGPGERRRFVDRLVSALDPEHASRCAAYEQASRRRSRLFRDGVSDAAWYEALEDTLARYGVAIAAARRDVVARLNQVLTEAQGPFPSATLALTGQIDEWLDSHAAVDAEDAFRQDMIVSRQTWSGHGDVPPQGPNRSDLDVRMADTGRQAAECSTGEQKALLVSIVLAHVQLQSDRQGYPPLLLLDEVAAHLDANRRRYLFDRVLASGTQAWMTGTDASVFAELGDAAQIFSVSDGGLVPVPTASSASHQASRSNTLPLSQFKTG